VVRTHWERRFKFDCPANMNLRKVVWHDLFR